ncbi:23S rRNA (cytidine1920-2'-O)/16S rRNA (cytidine1409-2'-O)-methyltransferase [Peptoclostridium litorale DSM 5388]|uniref:Ribosomal RNA large subunit methyltransferase J n=1 Tax=Peptoclostridium litorale DSM 5388 TaxID=1121324 RepID=A0A069RD31_PEPLI|nr:TlyA family RNA methyltransferase [Peptoclostridium litorale]KDR94115.1 ribosomal RNA large subunit methyltransferase J [Peptoclostridium litorale DSM 5388]SIN81059.1 23S rRNA (cytidine1920-2'-O)/16S rRNA (cytidine1409-2'-O)-methyltransferase [Peptoclostridium litorale DSM 5388]
MKKRIDVLLFEKGLVESRERAKTTVMAGIVLVDNQKVDKPGTKVDEDADIRVKGKVMPFVSRGGLKLDKAIKKFDIDLEDKICMDIGASTGGFTDCMLQNGAKRVYSIDVGYGQLAWKLRSDERVVCMERTNIRNVTSEDIQDKADFASIDVSFISLKLVIPVVRELIRENACIVALIKPQFEAGKENVGKKGVVRDKKVHADVINTIVDFVQETGFEVLGIDFSPVKGPEGNIEYLLYIQKSGEALPRDLKESISVLVDNSHNDLNS